MKALKVLIWVYFALLLIEGALRKWLLPQFSDPLLIIRDPIVLLIYAQAWRLGVLRCDGWLGAAAVMSFCALAAGLLAETVNPVVMIFGFRTDFLHLPLIFLLPRVFDQTDVQRIGRVFLALAVPMTFLMVLQFRAGPHDWINTGVGGGWQIGSALGRIRPAGTFSFISGPSYFFAAVAAFVLFSQIQKGAYPGWLTALAGGSTMLACSVSGSRGMLGAVVVVGVSLMGGLFLYPRAIPRLARLALVGGVLFMIVSGTEIFREGQEVLGVRIANAAGSEGGLNGFLARFRSGFAAPFTMLFEVPIFGHGFGLGTNAGAALSGARGKFLLAEDEWGRVMMESGPIVGLAFILLRTGLALCLGLQAARSARKGQLFPLLLFGAAGLGLILGQWGQPTTQGFITFLSGLCLASMRNAAETQEISEPMAGIVPDIGSARRLSVAATAMSDRRSMPDMDASQAGRFAIRG